MRHLNSRVIDFNTFAYTPSSRNMQFLQKKSLHNARISIIAVFWTARKEIDAVLVVLY
jgi:hypothetical protein